MMTKCYIKTCINAVCANSAIVEEEFTEPYQCKMCKNFNAVNTNDVVQTYVPADQRIVFI